MITQPLKIAPRHGQNVVKSQPVTWHRSPESVWQRVPLRHGYPTEKKQKISFYFELRLSSFSNDGQLINGKHYSNAKVFQKMKSVTKKNQDRAVVESDCVKTAERTLVDVQNGALC